MDRKLRSSRRPIVVKKQISAPARGREVIIDTLKEVHMNRNRAAARRPIVKK